jgi:hypothetical protein
VSDDDEDEQNAVDLAQFDTNLIELPPDTPKNGHENGNGIAVAALSVSTEKVVRSNGMQYKSDGKLTQLASIMVVVAYSKFSAAGMLVVDGLQAGVGAEGIVRLKKGDLIVASMVRRLPMRDRLVVLCKLGQGASSAVYKALDLTDMRLVALKMIHVNDRYVTFFSL